jgi:hypothetical protein
MTFLNDGIPGNSSYTFTADYNGAFPFIYDWIRLADYNCDGKEDIFTYGIGGIKVYKNVSDATSGLKFKLVTNEIQSFQFTMYQGLFVSSVDYPVIADMDGDGDLDILTFWVIGTYLHYHRNMSMEKYGVCDSLDFKLNSQCWGRIKENDSTNSVTLNAPCPFKDCKDNPGVLIDSSHTRHTGSTLLALHLNGDNLIDVLIGDVDFPNIVALYNGGTMDTARITSTDASFPSYDVPLNLFSFPSVSTIDVNNDGKRDLIAAPFDPQYAISENRRSVWLYKNHGTNSNPIYDLSDTAFLQKSMIDRGSNAMPVIFDVNGDGLQDIVVGNLGIYDSSWYYNSYLYTSYTASLTLYLNTGTSSVPAFSLADTNFAGIYGLGLTSAYPAFGDLDGDGVDDMLLGSKDGKLMFFHNNNTAGQLPAYAAPVLNYQGIDAGDYCTPQLFDLDNDGKKDLVIGNQKGLLMYYHNDGSPGTPVFNLVNDSLGKVDVRDPNISNQGYSVPAFFQTSNGDTRLFVGGQKGGIAYYKDIPQNLNGEFTMVSQYYLSVHDGERSAPAVAFLNNDTLADLLLGTVSGGLLYYNGIQPGPVGIEETWIHDDVRLNVFPNPCHDVISVRLDTPINTEADYYLCDLVGRVVLKGKVFSNQQNRLNISSLENGVYFVNVGIRYHVGSNKLVKRIIVQK